MEKTYMQQYYADNKVALKAKLMVKVECPLCKRIVSHGFINKHKKMDICRRNQLATEEMSLEDKVKMLEDKLAKMIKQSSQF